MVASRYRFPAACLGLVVALATFPARAADPLTLTLMPRSTAAAEKPLPPAATVGVRVILQNTGAGALARIRLKVDTEGLKAENPAGWRADGSGFTAEIPRLGAGEKIERAFSARVEPPASADVTARIAVQARADDSTVASAEARFAVADCAGAYRMRLAAIRTDQINAVKRLAEETRKAEPGLPRGRIFPGTGARTGPLASAERLAGQFAAGAGADTELATQGNRWLVLRWTADLGNYAGQDKNPGLCAGVPELLPIYRNSIAPLTRRFEAIGAAAKATLALAREETKADDENLTRMARRLADKVGVEGIEDGASTFAILTKTRAFFNDKERKLDADDARAFSLVETAAWLAHAAKRADALAATFDGTLNGIASAYKDTCVCAF